MRSATRSTSCGLSKEYHLALHLDHPNAFDLAMLELDGRDPSFMSTGINVHGGAISYGCVVIGNRNIEEFFMLAYLAGKENTKVFIFPHDTDRTRPVFKPCDHCPVWYAELQRTLAVHLAEFKRCLPIPSRAASPIARLLPSVGISGWGIR